MEGFTRRQFLRVAGAGAGSALLSGIGGFRGTAHGAAPTFTGVTYLTPAYEDSYPPLMGFVNLLKKQQTESFDAHPPPLLREHGR